MFSCFAPNELKEFISGYIQRHLIAVDACAEILTVFCDLYIMTIDVHRYHVLNRSMMHMSSVIAGDRFSGEQCDAHTSASAAIFSKTCEIIMLMSSRLMG